MGYFLQPPALHCWGPFPKIGSWRGREAWTGSSASQQQVPLSPWQPVLPQKSVTPPRGGHWRGRVFLRNSLGHFFSSFMCSCVAGLFHYHPPQQLEPFLPRNIRRRQPGEVRQPELAFCAPGLGRRGGCAHSLQVGERWHCREQWHSTVVLAASWWLGHHGFADG